MARGRANAPAERDITEGVIWKQILFFFFPIVLGTFFQQLYNTADAIIVGKYVGKEALAAVGGATGNLINMSVGLFVGLASGGTVIISQYFGARKMDQVSRTVHTSMALALTGGAVIMAVGYILSPTVLKWMNTPESVMGDAVTYIRIYFLGMIPSLIYNVGSGILRAMGDSRRPLFFLIAACVTNIVLDVVLVMGMNLGVAGAAIATIFSQLVSAVLGLYVLVRSETAYQLHFRQIRFHGDLLYGIVRIGLPAGLQSVLFSLSNVIIQSAINNFGTDVMAAWTAWGKIDGLCWMVQGSFGIAVTTFVGQNFGAGKIRRMQKGVRQCLLMSMISTVIVSCVVLLMGRGFYELFTEEESVIEYGLQMMYVLAPCYILYLFIEIYSGAMRGAGESLVPTLITLVGICVLRLIWVLGVVPNMPGLTNMLLCYPITWFVTSLTFLLYYHRTDWLQRNMKRRGITARDEE